MTERGVQVCVEEDRAERRGTHWLTAWEGGYSYRVGLSTEQDLANLVSGLGRWM